MIEVQIIAFCTISTLLHRVAKQTERLLLVDRIGLTCFKQEPKIDVIAVAAEPKALKSYRICRQIAHKIVERIPYYRYSDSAKQFASTSVIVPVVVN